MLSIVPERTRVAVGGRFAGIASGPATVETFVDCDSQQLRCVTGELGHFDHGYRLAHFALACFDKLTFSVPCRPRTKGEGGFDALFDTSDGLSRNCASGLRRNQNIALTDHGQLDVGSAPQALKFPGRLSPLDEPLLIT